METLLPHQIETNQRIHNMSFIVDEVIEAATVQPQPPIVAPKMPVRVKKPNKEAR